MVRSHAAAGAAITGNGLPHAAAKATEAAAPEAIGNVTGLSLLATDLTGKRIELLREVLPGLRRLALLGNVGNPQVVVEIGEVQAAARTLGLDVVTSSEIRKAEDATSSSASR
jgi:putative ABC transport system substrate-binding protein